jgi:hypothetical protein
MGAAFPLADLAFFSFTSGRPSAPVRGLRPAFLAASGPTGQSKFPQFV